MKLNKMNGNKGVKIVGFLAILGSLVGCSSQTDSIDGKTYDISKNQDNSLTIKITYTSNTENGSYYTLSIEGSGESKNYENRKTPWQSIIKKVKEINISEGITTLGTNYFNNAILSSYVLPSTLTSFTSTSFNSSAKLYAKNSLVDKGESTNDLYLYKETAPSESEKKTNKYWHYVNNVPVIWSTIKVLFIGNSFTFYNDIPKLTEEIAKSIGYDFKADSITCGSYTLTKFADQSDAYGKQVYEKLNSNKDYDYVILQDQSARSYSNYSAFKTAVDTLNKLVKKTQDHAETRLYATWAYDGMSSTNTITQQEQIIREKYEQCGNELGIKVHNVGKAFSKVYEENKEINLYFTDNKHPSHYGSFLSAHVHAMSLLGIDTRNSTFLSYYSSQEKTTWTISGSEATILKDAAYSVCFNK